MTEINQNPADNNNNVNTGAQTQTGTQGQTQTGTQGQGPSQDRMGGTGWSNQRASLITRDECIEKLRVAFLKGDAPGLYNMLGQVPQHYNPQSVLHEALSQAEKPSIMDRIRYRKAMDWVLLASASALSAGCGIAGTIYAMADPDGSTTLVDNSEEGVHSPSVVDFQQSA